jgi:hypothetical protein
MTNPPEITVIVVFHRERSFVVPALASLSDMVRVARVAGLTVEARAILDRTDDMTRHLVAARGAWLDSVEEVSLGDPGLTRNAAVRSAHGHFVSLLDGDDLWGAEWLRLAHRAASAHENSLDAIWHPEHLYYFYENDFDRHFNPDAKYSAAKSFHLIQQSSEVSEFERRALLLENVWTANAFASRELYLRYPYEAQDRTSGFGIEDWSWNLKTVWEGVPHYVVEDTVHLIRQKDTGSRGQLDISEGLLPRLPEAPSS